MARKIAREKAIPLTLHWLNFIFLRGAFEQRSKAVLRDSDHSIFIHDGRSKGTSNEIKLAVKMGHAHTIYTLAITKWKSSVGFDIDTDWEIESSLLSDPLGNLLHLDAPNEGLHRGAKP